MIRQVWNWNTVNHYEKKTSKGNKKKVFVQTQQYVYAYILLTEYILMDTYEYRMPRNILHLFQLSYSAHSWNGNRSPFTYELNF